MSDNYFLAEEPAPDEAAIRAALGERANWYEGVLAAAEGFERTWKHYGKKYGWKLKVHDGAKALFELTVMAAGFRISIAARESEMESLREAPETSAVLEELQPPGKAREGWGIRVPMDSGENYERALLLIKAIAELRRGE